MRHGIQAERPAWASGGDQRRMRWRCRLGMRDELAVGWGWWRWRKSKSDAEVMIDWRLFEDGEALTKGPDSVLRNQEEEYQDQENEGEDGACFRRPVAKGPGSLCPGVCTILLLLIWTCRIRPPSSLVLSRPSFSFFNLYHWLLAFFSFHFPYSIGMTTALENFTPYSIREPLFSSFITIFSLPILSVSLPDHLLPSCLSRSGTPLHDMTSPLLIPIHHIAYHHRRRYASPLFLSDTPVHHKAARSTKIPPADSLYLTNSIAHNRLEFSSLFCDATYWPKKKLQTAPSEPTQTIKYFTAWTT